jgi:hypothetical protein
MKNERRRLAGWIVSGECIMCVGRQLKAHLAKVVFFNTKRAPEGRRTRGGRIPKRSGPIWSNCAAKTAQNVKMYPTSIRQVLYCTPSGNKCFTARDNVYIPLVAF